MAAGSGDLSDIYRPQELNAKRTRFLANLPSEHQNLFRSGDRFIIQNASLVSARVPRLLDRIEFVKEEPVSISVFSYEGVSPLTSYARSCIHAYALSIFYSVAWQDKTNPLYVETLGAILTILSTYTPYPAMVDTGIERELARCHVKVNKTTWHTLAEVIEATKEVRESVVVDMGLPDFDSSPQAVTVVALSTLILIGKNVTEIGRDGWFKNRWKALAQVSSVSMDTGRVEPPLLRQCQAVYTAASANNPVRSCIFKIMRTLASITNNQNHVIFDRIIRLLGWAEMSHIWMIIDYIYGQNPDVLNFPELCGPEISTMMIAISFLKTFPKEDRPFLKLLHDHNDLIPLHSNNFIHFTAAAHAIAAMTKTSMLNINSRFSEGVKAFQSRIVGYINMRNKVGPLAAAVGYGMNIPRDARGFLVESVQKSSESQEIPDFVDQQPEARE